MLGGQVALNADGLALRIGGRAKVDVDGRIVGWRLILR
jgi:hypothetical protein